MRCLITILLGLFLWAAGLAQAEDSLPPLVPEGEQFSDVEKLLASISRNSPINAVAFSPDGTTLASGSKDGIIRLWDVASGRERLRLSGHTDEVNTIAFSPDGATLASGSDDNTVRLWDVASGRERLTLIGHTNKIKAVAFSPDGVTLASASIIDRTVLLWDITSGRERLRLTGHTEEVNAIAFSPDGTTLASGSHDKTVRLWDVASGREKETLTGHTPSVAAVAFSPDGTTLASCSFDGSVRLWDVASERPRLIFDFAVASPNSPYIYADDEFDKTKGATIISLAARARFRTLVFSPDSFTVAAVADDDGIIQLWDVASGRERLHLSKYTDEKGCDVKAFVHLRAVIIKRVDTSLPAFSPDGTTLASGSRDGIIRLWDVASGRERLQLASHTNEISAIAFSPDGATLASGSEDGNVRLWDMTNGRERLRLGRHTERVGAVAFSPDGTTLASNSDDDSELVYLGTDYCSIYRDGVMLWDVASGREERKLLDQQRSTLLVLHDYNQPIAFSPDGATLAKGYHDGSVQLWDLASGNKPMMLRESKLSMIEEKLYAIAFSPDGTSLAAGFENGLIRWWDLASESEYPRRLIKQQSLTTNKRQSLRQTSHIDDLANAAAFSPDGTTLATGSKDGTVRLWDVASGHERLRLTGHTQRVNAIAFSPDGTTLASGSSDNTVRLWDLAKGRPQLTLTGHAAAVRAVAFSPDGATLASGSADRNVRLWSRVKGTSDYRLSRIMMAGQGGNWIACDMPASRCWRGDDGTLLLQSAEDGQLAPIPPPLPDTPANLQLAFSPPAIQTTDGTATPFKLKIRNQGAGRAYWINVLAEGDSKQYLPVVFHPPTIQTSLEPGAEAELECYVSALSSPENPRSQSTALRLKITSAYGEPIPVTIPVTTQTPSLDWGEARWLQDKGRSILAVSLTNSGAQALTATEFKAQFAGQPAPLDIVNREGTQAGEKFDLSFALPENLKLDKTARVSLSAFQLEHPMHRWQFIDRPVIPPTPPWQLYTALALLMLGTGVGTYYLYLYRHPLVTRLSAQPAALLELTPTELPQAKKLLTRTRRLNSVLAGAKVYSTWLEGALAFTRNNPQERCQVLTRRLGLSCQPRNDSGEWWTLPLGERFPLNLNQCLLYLPPTSLAAADIRTRLQNDAELADQVILILSPDPVQQTELHQWATDPGNLWVAPTPAELTGLLLATDPIANLARLIAAQIPFKRLSPYQTGGGLSREAMFFGRSQELAHILNRELTNYLVVGGRQIGKTTLLKALERRYQDKPQITCHYLVLSDVQLIERLARTLGLPPTTDLDGILSHLISETQGARVLLIDEADLFIRAERERNYPTLRRLRALSEEGRCYFILAGFWELYAAAVLDYQSPLKNFGEVLQLGALEVPACRDLATQPMTTMNLRYRSEDLVKRLVTATGQRANLISIACNQILQSLTLHDRVIEAEAVERALDSDAMRQALTGWETLDVEDPAGSQRDRIIVYATIEGDAFTQPELQCSLDVLGYSATPQQVQRSLERLQLAYVIQREKEQYRYCVPLFRDWVVARKPQDQLQRELETGRL